MSAVPALTNQHNLAVGSSPPPGKRLCGFGTREPESDLCFGAARRRVIGKLRQPRAPEVDWPARTTHRSEETCFCFDRLL